MNKWIAPVASALVAILAVFAEPIQALIAAHPAWAGFLAAMGGIFASLAPQPHK